MSHMLSITRITTLVCVAVLRRVLKQTAPPPSGVIDIGLTGVVAHIWGVLRIRGACLRYIACRAVRLPIEAGSSVKPVQADKSST